MKKSIQFLVLFLFELTLNLEASSLMSPVTGSVSTIAKPIMTFVDLAALNSLTDAQLLVKIEKIIRLPEMLVMSDSELYEKTVQATPEELRLIFRNTVTLAHEVSQDIFKQFFNVSCLNQKVLNEYQNWLHARLMPAIMQLLKQRVMDVQNKIIEQFAQQALRLQKEEEVLNTAIVQQELIMQRTHQTQVAMLAITPVVTASTHFLIKVPPIRWISYAGFAVLVVSMLNQYRNIITTASHQNQNSRRLQEVVQNQVAALQTQAKAVQSMDRNVIDEVVGRMYGQLNRQIEDFVMAEEDRLVNELRTIEKDKERLFIEARREEVSPSQQVVPAPKSVTARVLQNSATRGLFKVGEAIGRFSELFSRK